MNQHSICAGFGARLVILGFGCIGRGVLPLLLRHIAIQPGQIRIVTDRAPTAMSPTGMASPCACRP